MNKYLYIIMACIFLNLNAFAGDLLSAEDQIQINATRDKLLQWQLANPHLSIADNERLQHDLPSCTTCAAPFALFYQLREVLRKMPDYDHMQPLGELDLQFAVARLNSPNGIICKSIFTSFDQRAEVRNLDGQLKQISEGVFEKYSSIAMLTYHDPDLKDAIYYYRDSANHVVQVIVNNQGKATFRYYEYIPKNKEKIMPELPNLGDESVVSTRVETPAAVDKSPTLGADEFGAAFTGGFKIERVPREGVLANIIPKDVKVYTGKGKVQYQATELSGKISTTLINGHQMDISIGAVNGNPQEAYLYISAKASATGALQGQKITVPVNLNIGTSLGIAGQVSEMDTGAGGQNHENKMILNFFEPVSQSNEAKKDIVALTITQHQGLPISYDVKKSFITTESVYTATVGTQSAVSGTLDPTLTSSGAFVGLSYAPVKNKKGEMVVVKIVDDNGHLAGYATYSLATDILK
jgi:hypothetical protein